MNKNKVEYLRNFVFGVEDSLVSTIGLVSGIAVAGVATKTILLTGVVLIFVEAFSMGAGALLSENVADEYSTQGEVSIKNDLRYAVVMFVSYLLSGVVILAPYIFLAPPLALAGSVILALIGLFTLGALSAKLAKVDWRKRSAAMIAIGGGAIILGIIVGQIVNFYV